MNRFENIPKSSLIFYFASILLAVVLLLIGIPRLVTPLFPKLGPSGIPLGLKFPFPWYLLIPTVVIVVCTIISEFKTKEKSNPYKIQVAYAIIGLVLIAAVSYFVYMSDYSYPRHGWYPAVFLTKPLPSYYTVYPPPLGYSQYLYYAIVGLFFLISALLTASLILKNRTDTG